MVAEGRGRRIYLQPTKAHLAASAVSRPKAVPDQECRGTFGGNAQGRRYGFRTFADYFTHRQLVALTTFSDLVCEARDRIAADAKQAGFAPGAGESYANGVALYLGFVVDKTIDRNSTLCTWEVGMDRLRGTFQRQALPMTWDFAEANPFGRAGGDLAVTLASEIEVLERLSGRAVCGTARQRDAQSVQVGGAVVSTDPPYYDNIGYADLSDFFYVWLRRSVGPIYPDVTATMLTPKAEELVANPYRFAGSKKKAEEHFERGFVHTFTRVRKEHAPHVPITIFYAFKQAESDGAETASTGWESMLNGLIEAGLMVTATWPMRTELGTRSIGRGANALASSIVLACRPQPASAGATSRRGFVAALKAELPEALRRLQQGSVAPVDLAQAAIGPGMAVFTRYGHVLETDGSTMTVRTALALINQVLDETLSDQEGDFDGDTRFCLAWFREFGWNKGKFGPADDLARAKNTSVAGLERGGVFRATKGDAWLVPPEDLRDEWDPLSDDRASVWEASLHIAKALSEQGSDAATSLMAAAAQRVDLDTVKELSYLLYSVCERRGWTQSAILFNALGTTWSDLDAVARQRAASPSATQSAFSFDE
jgi:putative DNA methylase